MGLDNCCCVWGLLRLVDEMTNEVFDANISFISLESVMELRSTSSPWISSSACDMWVVRILASLVIGSGLFAASSILAGASFGC